MIYGLYLSAQGADVQSLRQDVIANNLANASTSAFKRSLAVIQAHEPYDIEHGVVEPGTEPLQEHAGGVSVVETRIDFAGGSLQQTDAPLDLALSGPGFFQVTDGRQEYLTRDGRLDIDASGALVQRETRQRILNTSGQPILIDRLAGPISVTSDGLVSQTVGNVSTPLSQLAIVEPTDYLSLEQLGDNLFRTDDDVVPAPGEVRQGHLETSGTRPVLEMLDLLQTSRAFEANVNMIKHQDESIARLLTMLPRK